MSQFRSNWQNRAALAGRCAGLLSLALSAALVACGGGGGEVAVTPPVVTPATASAQGPILGFGSIIVGSVRWDESNASITDDDGVAQGRSALKLGMVVAVDGNALNKLTATGTATHVQFGSETVGPVASVNVAASSFVVLGQTIKVTATTVFDASITGALTPTCTLHVDSTAPAPALHAPRGLHCTRARPLRRAFSRLHQQPLNQHRAPQLLRDAHAMLAIETRAGSLPFGEMMIHDDVASDDDRILRRVGFLLALAGVFMVEKWRLP